MLPGLLGHSLTAAPPSNGRLHTVLPTPASAHQNIAIHLCLLVFYYYYYYYYYSGGGGGDDDDDFSAAREGQNFLESSALSSTNVSSSMIFAKGREIRFEMCVLPVVCMIQAWNYDAAAVYEQCVKLTCLLDLGQGP